MASTLEIVGRANALERSAWAQTSVFILAQRTAMSGQRQGTVTIRGFTRHSGARGDYLLPPLADIAAGSYPIGNNEGRYEDEAPAHQVRLAAFAIGRFPVTNAEWRLFITAGAYEYERWWEGKAAQVQATPCDIAWPGFVVCPGHRLRKARKPRSTAPNLCERMDNHLDGRISFGEFDASAKGW
ncbi:MAG TPA: SUMF1/EgtB/PvdO family nonheme iron enzyme [Accumulibacter sp.]|uniref:formylglycine-generating enzyme family protein n=1 Tax=Accumulibacter sp. TaxID=2053492 RepID=UPI000ECA875A|nr:SUMF1/EgtB/PvdO family nonheme iron enzyme [Accumulibacter sp.]HCZ13975.1 hypothetical protein [Accumulibacter sp.]HRF73463.1 SUMF1/EgtB/PvdO family nonheme iron enzyme [Accumulibacter sp.]